jgi:hypothetical protein
MLTGASPPTPVDCHGDTNGEPSLGQNESSETDYGRISQPLPTTPKRPTDLEIAQSRIAQAKAEAATEREALIARARESAHAPRPTSEKSMEQLDNEWALMSHGLAGAAHHRAWRCFKEIYPYYLTKEARANLAKHKKK